MVDQPFGDKANSRFEEFGKKVDERFNQARPRFEEELQKGNRLSQRSSRASTAAGLRTGAARCRGSIAKIGRTARRSPRHRSALRCGRCRQLLRTLPQLILISAAVVMASGCRHKTTAVTVAPPPALAPIPTPGSPTPALRRHLFRRPRARPAGHGSG